MNSRILLTVFFCLAISIPSFSIDFWFAPVLYREKVATEGEKVLPSNDLCKKLSTIDYEGNVSFRISDGEVSPASLMDAMQYASSINAAHLFYGYIRQDADSYYAEIKLLDAESQKIIVTIFASDSLDHYDRLIANLVEKIDFFMRDELGLRSKQEEKKPDQILGVRFAAGYWSPMTSDWLDYMMGLCKTNIGMRFIPTFPSLVIDNRAFFIELGADFAYELGRNQPGFENSWWHSGVLQLSCVGKYKVSRRQNVGVGVDCGMRFDWLIQNQKYRGTVLDFSLVPEVGGIVTYSFDLSPKVELGFDVDTAFSFYNKMLITVSPVIALTYWPGEKK